MHFRHVIFGQTSPEQQIQPSSPVNTSSHEQHSFLLVNPGCSEWFVSSSSAAFCMAHTIQNVESTAVGKLKSIMHVGHVIFWQPSLEQRTQPFSSVLNISSHEQHWIVSLIEPGCRSEWFVSSSSAALFCVTLWSTAALAAATYWGKQHLRPGSVRG